MSEMRTTNRKGGRRFQVAVEGKARYNWREKDGYWVKEATK